MVLKLLIISYVVFYSVSAFAQVAAQRQISANNVYLVNRQKLPAARASGYAPRPTSDCMGSFGLGAQAPFAGVSFGGTQQSQPCNDRENAASLAALGLIDMARRMQIAAICDDKRFKYLDECLKSAPQEKNNCDYPTKCEKRR